MEYIIDRTVEDPGVCLLLGWGLKAQYFPAKMRSGSPLFTPFEKSINILNAIANNLVFQHLQRIIL